MKTEKVNNLKILNPDVKNPPIKSHPDLPAFYHLLTVYAERGKGKTLTMSNILRLEAPYLTKIFWFSPTAEGDKKITTILAPYLDKVEFIDKLNMDNFNSMMTEVKSEIKDWKMKIKRAKAVSQITKRKKKIDHETLLEYLYEMGLYDMEHDEDLNAILRDDWEVIERDEKPAFYMIIDDELDNKLLSSRLNNPFNHFISTHRHFFVNVAVLIQNYTSLNNIIRRNAQQLIIYPSKDINMLKFLFKEIASLFDNYEQFENIMKYVDEKPYSFLFIDTATKSLRRNLDEKIIL